MAAGLFLVPYYNHPDYKRPRPYPPIQPYGYKKSSHMAAFSGERGIRTPGGVTLNGFQDRRNRPLCHLSKLYFQIHPDLVALFLCDCKVSLFLSLCQIYFLFLFPKKLFYDFMHYFYIIFWSLINFKLLLSS